MDNPTNDRERSGWRGMSVIKRAAAALVLLLAATFATASEWHAGEWQPYFAWWPVWVDAYEVSEIKNGKMIYRQCGLVERRYVIRTDEDGEHWEGWKYRPARPSVLKQR